MSDEAWDELSASIREHVRQRTGAAPTKSTSTATSEAPEAKGRNEDELREAIHAWLTETLERNLAEAPTEPGVYRLPCGECIVDFWITPEGEERWLVPGDPTSYTRESVVATRHGDHPWERLYTLAEAADVLGTGSPGPSAGDS